MKQLTEIQKNFLLDEFFRLEGRISWRGIATQLLDTGYCIVASFSNLWNGGIGNFITVKPVENSYECWEYTFNLEIFLKSSLYKERVDDYIVDLQAKSASIRYKIDEISKIK